jgi:hypothetical protein
MSQDNKILEKYEIQKKNLYSRDKKKYVYNNSFG